MSTCSNCPTGGKLRRGMCKRCYENHRNRMKAYGRWQPGEHIDAGPVREHVQMLIDAGVPRKKVARLAGVADPTLARLLGMTAGRPPSPTVTHRTTEALMAITVEEALPKVGGELIPAIGSQRRIRALVAAGWPIAELERRFLRPRCDLYVLLYHNKRVRVTTHERIVALFDELQLIPGPSDQARALGAERHWPLPMQWDEDALDDPDAPTPPSILRRQTYRSVAS